MKMFLTSLGCAKNLVDSELLTGCLVRNGFSLTKYPSQASLLLINTCGFIDDAKKEAIETILEMIAKKKPNQKLVVTGCLVNRYQKDLETSLKEVDLFVPISQYKDFPYLISKLYNKDFKYEPDFNSRYLLESNYSPYLRISDGCDNKCSYCAIPLIRGPYQSRTMEDIVLEAKTLIDKGAKEINLISQDVSRYGFDLYHRLAIVPLLESIETIPGDFKIRLLYLYPDLVNDELINYIAKSKKVLPYFDIPIQHSETRLLNLMNRRGDKSLIKNLIQKIRKLIPNAIIRTTIIVGFPSETRQEIEELKNFLKEMLFDRLGVFMYSKEENTSSYEMKPTVSKKEKERRYNEIMSLANEISNTKMKENLGKDFQVLVTGYDPKTYFYYGRSYQFAKDDIDGLIYFGAHRELKAGDIVCVRVLDSDDYNLYGEEKEE